MAAPITDPTGALVAYDDENNVYRLVNVDANGALPVTLSDGEGTAVDPITAGSAGAPSADVVTVQGIAGGVALPVSGTLIIDSTLAADTFTIASGASLSAAVDLAGRGILRLVMPATWTAANLTFAVSQDGATYADLYDASGNERVIVAAASRSIILSPAEFAGFRYVKIRSGTAAAAVSQGADRVITAVTKVL